MRLNTSVIMAYRADATGIRASNAGAVLKWLAAMKLNVILAEHSAAPDLSLAYPPEVKRIHIESDDAFNKAAACNQAFENVTDDVVAFVDADMVMKSGKFLGCLQRVTSHDEVIRPFGSLYELSPEQRAKYVAEGELPVVGRRPRDDRRGTETIPPCGGIVMLQSERYLMAGGMDERFFGWGGEDDALSAALARIGSTMLVLKDEPAFHLWHPRPTEDRLGHPQYGSNLDLAHWWHSAPATDIYAHVHVRRTALVSSRQTAARSLSPFSESP